MSMTLELLEITPETFTYLASDLDAFEEFQNRVPSTEMLWENLDKAWHGIHFLLTDSVWEGKPPLNFLLKGGKEFGHDLGYGPPRYLSPAEVATISEVLDEIPYRTFEKRIDPILLASKGIYPTGWNHAERDTLIREYLISHYRILRSSLDVVRHRGNGMILHLC
jgi:hypothetical protein